MRGFSLVELSIVLVILGLLTGGILAGQSLIRASELRSVSTDFQRIKTATATFRDKYFAYPGDFRDATKFWGTDPDGCPSHTNRVAKAATCNGNGNGIIEQGVAGLLESQRQWQHLANAGLIEGSYWGVDGAGAVDYDVVAGSNAPRCKLGGQCAINIWTITGLSAGDASWFPTPDGAILHLGGQMTNENPWTAIFKAEEMWNIDTKMDDGRPAYGIVFTPKSPATACTASATASTAEYALTNTGMTCVLLAKLGY